MFGMLHVWNLHWMFLLIFDCYLTQFFCNILPGIISELEID